MLERAGLTYQYDGSLEGFYCCVFASFSNREIPAKIIAGEPEQLLLGKVTYIETEPEKAKRVSDSIPQKISAEAAEMVWKGYLGCHPQKERLLLNFLRLGFRRGPSVTEDLTDPIVHELQKEIGRFNYEAHRFVQFLRFSLHGPYMTAVIHPKSQVLPIIAPHYCDRFPNEVFLIYDATNKMALVHQPGESAIVPMEEYVAPPPNEEELFYRNLWRKFFKTIGIEGRKNKRCQMNFLPKWYRPDMTEFQPEETGSQQILL